MIPVMVLFDFAFSEFGGYFPLATRLVLAIAYVIFGILALAAVFKDSKL
jgi:hypothetical protein